MTGLHGKGFVPVAAARASGRPGTRIHGRFRGQRGARQPRLAVPHDLAAGVRIALPVSAAAGMRDRAGGVAEPLRRRQAVFRRAVAQEGEFAAGEHQLRFAVGNLASEQGHDRDALRDDRVDRDRPLQPVGGAEQQEFDAVPVLQDSKPVLEGNWCLPEKPASCGLHGVNCDIPDAKIRAGAPFPAPSGPNRPVSGNSSRGRHETGTHPKMQVGEVRIEDIGPDLRTRDHIPALLLFLQRLCADEGFRSRLFALLDEQILPGIDRKVGRPGTETRRFLATGVIRQGPGCDYDRLRELANEHGTLRRLVPRACGCAGRLSLQLPEAGGQREPSAPRTACCSQPADRGERPCSRGNAWQALARAVLQLRGGDRRALSRQREPAAGRDALPYPGGLPQTLFRRMRAMRRASAENAEAYLGR